MSGLAVAFVLVFVVVLDDGGELALVTRPLPMQVALLFPYLIAVLAFGTTAGTLLAWWRRYWSLPTRIHQTILAVLGIGFTWQLHELGFVVI